MLSFFIIILLNLYMIKEVKNEACSSFQCISQIEEGKCIKKDNSIFLLKQCQEGYYCDSLTEYPTTDTTCENISDRKILKYETMPCTSNEECFLKTCNEKGQCLKDGTQFRYCTNTNECLFDCYCDREEKQCLKFRTDINCIESSQCAVMHGCLNNRCIPYFSLEDNAAVVEETEKESSNRFSFCKSGYSYDGKCTNLHLINPYQSCDQQDNKCIYQFDDGTRITLADKCKCGFEGSGLSYCELGSGDHNYTMYISALKQYYARSGQCHMDERDKIPCLKDALSEDEGVKEMVKKLISKKLWATRNYRMYDATDCAHSIFYPDYDSSYDEINPLPDDIACPTFYCENPDKLNTCADIHFKSFQSINITLYDACSQTQMCPPLNYSDPLFYKNHSIQCQEVTKSKHRYPGEPCEKNTDCLTELCENSICKAKRADNFCNTHDDCLVGYYCERVVCQEQVSLRETCSSTYACQNSHYCYNGTCQDIIFTQPDNTSLSNLVNEANYPTPEKICLNDYQYNQKCSSLRSKESLPLDEDYLNCSSFSKCFYMPSVDESAVISKNCSCNYNRNGMQYCPQDHFQEPIMRKRYLNALKRSYDNKCHTKKRYDCDLLDEGLANEIKMYRNAVERGHLFYKSELCAEKVLQGRHHRVALALWAISLLSLI